MPSEPRLALLHVKRSERIVLDRLERLAEQYRGGARYFAPRALVQSATRSGLFAMGDMHDSQEFYLHVLDGLLQANLRGKPTPPDPGPLAEPLVGSVIRRP